MPCDPNELIEQAKCLNACIPQGMMPAVNTSLLCQILEAGGGGGGVTSFNTRTGAVTLTLGDVSTVADSHYLLKAGDTFTGTLTAAFGSIATSKPFLDLSQTWNGPGVTFTGIRLAITNNFSAIPSYAINVLVAGNSQFSVRQDGTVNVGYQLVIGEDGIGSGSMFIYNTKTSSTNFERLDLQWTANVAQLWTEKGSGGGTARALVLGADATELLRFGSSTTISFFAATAVVKQTSGENLTNNVTSGGTDGAIANYTDLTVYANDSAAIRNDIYQLARKLKQINDGLRAYGLFT